jgi:glycosyltransferase involved in cell wall biosynthesis
MSLRGVPPLEAPSYDVSVTVLSYDRVALLERTLLACLAQIVPAGLRFEIIVADNHPDRLAEGLVARLAGDAAVPLRYIASPVRNISVIRNAAIAAARGRSRYLAMTDDDEAPDPDWVANLHACLERTGADAAFGPKYPVFETGAPPPWDPEGWYFTLDFRLPADAPIAMFGRRRRRGKGLGSGNTMFRMATCFALGANGEEPFNPAFGNAGGEDTELLFRLFREGRRFVWCPDARVREFMQTTRMEFDYIRTRLKRGSQHYAASRVAQSGNKTLARLKVAVLGLGQIAVHGALYLGCGEFLRADRVDNRIGIAKGLGKLTYRAPIGFIEEKRWKTPSTSAS